MSLAAPVRPDAAGPARTNAAAVLTALTTTVLSYGLMQTMLVPAVGVLQAALSADTRLTAWAVLTAPLLTSAVLTPLISALGDRHGRRRVLLAVLVCFLVATVGAALAPGLGALLACRAVQGVSLAVVPLSLGLVREALPPDRVAFGSGLVSGTVGGGAGLALVVGGLICDHVSWRWLFAAGGLVILAALALVAWFVPDGTAHADGPLDLGGAALLGGGLVALLVALTQGPAWGWAHPGVLALFAACVALLALFVVVERRHSHPLVDVRTLANGPLLVAHLGALVLGAAQFVTYVLVPRIAQLPHGLPADAAPLVDYGFALSVTGAGLLMLPGTLVILPASAVTGAVERRFGPCVPLVLGLAATALGCAALAAWHRGEAQVVLGYLVASVGFGFAMAAMPRLVNSAVPATRAASANGVNTVARTVGGAIGSQLAAAILSSLTLAGGAAPSETGFSVAFWAGAAVALVGAVLPFLVRPARGEAVVQPA
ncbi:Major Facilitator Superfamily protein [Streptoalloteichus tenebrarius]|uniref:Major Facilitator Superfamily protein n=1 Tax=Streptoalloteichus tenebrarius (strain ATCC 17920 / DSM 40477 / JCM 4838 / CBS 697.72 / NBRC 16177 / NCIMB 11028 / NRRL B-12390 / A12253. 1 / ISP 5477) TaxID=1933 RepID=A0ABT1HQR2_STRSD|nr:MFS transporter [Streptoalloteichus tenebrarius]MCP2257860.1 Major Facilitator Superfamily protein [Streptoalloteichus tenebrarius]BFE99778.1 MFS transporter [Streptoalloteichus tenebrarius]